MLKFQSEINKSQCQILKFPRQIFPPKPSKFDPKSSNLSPKFSKFKANSTKINFSEKIEKPGLASGCPGIAANSIRECRTHRNIAKFHTSTGTHQFRRRFMHSTPNRAPYNFPALPQPKNAENEGLGKSHFFAKKLL